VSSGAIALGRRQLGLGSGRLRLEESQAAAAVGQIRLAHAWKEVLEQHQCTVAQVLVTLGDTEVRRRYLNARNTLETLLKLGAIPVINENDTVATAEIRYGDNDRLAARVAQMASADCLVLLSDVDGLYTGDPTLDPAATFIPEVTRITPEIEAMAGGSASDVGSGGMATKVMAGKIALAAGCSMCIAVGREPHPLQRLEDGARCTWFVAEASPRTVRKQWIAGSLKPAGTLHVDDGAAGALRDGKSLLPAGITRVEGGGSVRPRRRRERTRPGRHRAGARAERLFERRRAPCLRAAEPRARGDPGVSWARRDHPPRRPGAADVTDHPTLAATMQALGRNAVAAQRELALADGARRARALQAMAAALRRQQAQILEANELDSAAASRKSPRCRTRSAP
jgi:glutamate 5-kinase